MFLEMSQNSQENTCAIKFIKKETLLKKRLSRRCFPVNFVKFLRYLFLKSTPGGCFYDLPDHIKSESFGRDFPLTFISPKTWLPAISPTLLKTLAKEHILSKVTGCTQDDLRKRNSFTVIFLEFCKNFEQHHMIIKDQENTFQQKNLCIYYSHSFFFSYKKYIFIQSKEKFFNEIFLYNEFR